MMRVTWAKVGGTQFTGYMAMMNLSAIIGYGLIGAGQIWIAKCLAGFRGPWCKVGGLGIAKFLNLR